MAEGSEWDRLSDLISEQPIRVTSGTRPSPEPGESYHVTEARRVRERNFVGHDHRWMAVDFGDDGGSLYCSGCDVVVP